MDCLFVGYFAGRIEPKFFFWLKALFGVVLKRPEILVLCVYGSLVNDFEGLLIGERLDFECLRGWKDWTLSA